ncbi:galactose-1-phosphate uridylyltransferase [[Clostridium] sordellii]|uniref:UDP-glucose--hexose-1-phosphate uridylyltransferase n=1 Tax=Paraclostridium sordellii TaxID=1505 RepID=UPI0005E3BCC8|nr:UDP-glucose--hexose-1-phosphate uridylyltransferase [Paeniclostridium sordellii]MDU6481461.1 UDP-glucose--hexose-1-phosphate uridylyltransferase [Paeniclostridium sordellii]CEN83296.1 galactose-1-phosphate uridylyltransferase [[Clostridium] sordellii] [Paeniclostridium sordellii]CEO11157.1 galactose-1-phosphate uridylyltransferase [[Clostridium] sordellii] [Paeniclostridium sordellii]CEQ10133.1 galactose-1-phosphate uridylyltransferase [[Clostridium] sordellii] [Paeniclostridium sordellii]
MSIYTDFERLINYGLKHELFLEEDKVYIRNSLIELFNIDEYIVPTEVLGDDNLEDIMNNLLDYAYEKNILESNTSVYRDLLDTKIMSLLIPRPSEVTKEFNKRYKKDKVSATDYLYNLSKSCDYVRTNRIAQNINWKTNTEYGDIDITINLSKPEKDPKAIAKARELKTSSYPTCLLCKENVGYRGRLNHPARQNLRIIPLNLNKSKFYLQYSPYSYYNEHCIIFSDKHEPMTINKNTFDRNLDFLEQFPHYFIGSNADLPIVGGSILSHDHYQGGRYEFAMDRAKDILKIDLKGYEDVNISMIKWPLSVVRLNSNNREKLSILASYILNHWKGYTDAVVNIHSHTENTLHNTITPIARRKGENFELDLVLRNNKTSEEHPDGIFHPHKELHHIKKENIGLIEVLGLAVLPARLKEELEIIKKCLLKEKNEEYILKNLNLHLEWFNYLKKKYGDFNKKTIDDILKDEVGLIFKKVLEDCGVFKFDEEGLKARNRYIQNLKEYMGV